MDLSCFFFPGAYWGMVTRYMTPDFAYFFFPGAGPICPMYDYRFNCNLLTFFHKILAFFRYQCYYIKASSSNRCVAQLGRALRSGRRGRKFKSCRID